MFIHCVLQPTTFWYSPVTAGGGTTAGGAVLETETTSEDVDFIGDVAGCRYTVEIIVEGADGSEDADGSGDADG